MTIISLENVERTHLGNKTHKRCTREGVVYYLKECGDTKDRVKIDEVLRILQT